MQAFLGDPTYLAILRWIHIGAGIVWIGLLYYFNFVQVPSFAQMEAPARMQAIRFLVPRALLWFRWAAVVTVGVGLLWIVSFAIAGGEGYLNSPRFKSIVVGGTFGLIMLTNVWMIIWPNQRRIIAATTETLVNQTPAPPEQPRWARRAFLASRLNTAFSLPMLFFMVGANHLGGLWI